MGLRGAVVPAAAPAHPADDWSSTVGLSKFVLLPATLCSVLPLLFLSLLLLRLPLWAVEIWPPLAARAFGWEQQAMEADPGGLRTQVPRILIVWPWTSVSVSEQSGGWASCCLRFLSALTTLWLSIFLSLRFQSKLQSIFFQECDSVTELGGHANFCLSFTPQESRAMSSFFFLLQGNTVLAPGQCWWLASRLSWSPAIRSELVGEPDAILMQ